jgi:hypothetical protein
MACLDHMLDPAIFSSNVTEQTLRAKIKMAFGIVLMGRVECEVFPADVSTVTAERAKELMLVAY